MSQNEPQLIKLFNEYLYEQAKSLGCVLDDFALGGADVHVGGDWLYRADHLFTLVEYKAVADGYTREKKKSRRERLCQLLPVTPNIALLHEKCHFIAWGDDNGLFANVYSRQVCNAEVFPALTGRQGPDTASIVDGWTFARKLLSPDAPAGIVLAEFDEYLAWLMKETSGEETGRDLSVQLVVRDRSSPGFRTKSFASVAELDHWLRASLQVDVAPNVEEEPSQPEDRGSYRSTM